MQAERKNKCFLCCFPFKFCFFFATNLAIFFRLRVTCCALKAPPKSLSQRVVRSLSNDDFELLHMPNVASLTFQHTPATGKIGFLWFSDGIPIMKPGTQGERTHLSEGSGDRMGTTLKILFCVFAIKHQGERQRRRGKCSLPVEALTEDESFLGIKEAPSLIIPWWDASSPHLPQSQRRMRHEQWTEDTR